MKGIIKRILAIVIAVFITRKFVLGFIVEENYQSIAPLVLTLFLSDMVLNPALKIILSPFTFLTSFLAKALSYALVLFAISKLINGIHFESWHFQGFATNFLNIPEKNLDTLPTLLITATLLALATALINWISD